MGYIYLVTNKITHQKYVGQTLHDDVETRWKQHRQMRSKMLGRYILNAYRKYGIENFEFKIICMTFDECCNAMEEYYIKKFNTLAPNGYNLRQGGKNSKHSEESKDLMRQNRKGKGLGVVYTEEMRRERSERFIGEKNPNYGKPISEEQKQKISERMKELWKQKKEEGYTLSENLLKALEAGRQKRIEDAKNRRESKPISKGRKQRVAKLDEFGNILEEFDSIENAAGKLGLCSAKISAVCRGERKTTGGFRWKYLFEEGETGNRNRTTGELYISKQGTGFMVRLSKKVYKVRQWFKTLEEAVWFRDKCVSEMNN
jgi:group I intron endonuclease